MELWTVEQNNGDQIRISIQIMDQFKVLMIQNGAVFAYGQLDDFQGWSNVPYNGFIELTDTAKMKPVFLDELRGALSGAEGTFGIFGSFHIVKNCRDAKAFLTNEGIVLACAVLNLMYQSSSFQITRFDNLSSRFWKGIKDQISWNYGQKWDY
ncbi:MAG: hypothetical protein EZS28_025353 [Streblomastix strix]|uniref:Uncharacterized protein n=1 Tax=Streblomastix strix TaxID=222440 RepID=A0A5J4V9J2_9EUKA|nr:MAG: hypothetical protein EZS28_025353 [Streblomastix strix]